MQKAKETLTVVLMLYILTSAYAVIWQLLVLHHFPGLLSYSILLALVPLKSLLIRLRTDMREQDLSAADRSRLALLLKLSLLLFCFVLLVSFFNTDQPVQALLSLLTFLLGLTRLRSLDFFTSSNP